MMAFDLTDPFGMIGWDLVWFGAIEMDLIGFGAVADMK